MKHKKVGKFSEEKMNEVLGGGVNLVNSVWPIFKVHMILLRSVPLSLSRQNKLATTPRKQFAILRSQIEGYTRLLIFRKFSILPTVI